MGTTLSVMWRGRGYMYIAHVGDSRIYRLRKGKLEQITQDHSLVDELVRAGLISRQDARRHPRRNIITRALAKPGDRWLLCTDGLNGMVDDADIERAMKGDDMQKAADQLIAMALDAGGSDNVTLILCTGEEDETWNQD